MTDASVYDDTPRGWRRYVYSTNHKDIGTMFLVFALFSGLVGGAFGCEMRLELMHPGLQHFAGLRDYAVMVTGHGILMKFFALLPAVLGFGYWLVPLMIGAPGLAFPRMSNLAFWLMPFALLLFALSFAVIGDADGNGVSVGWALTAPLSTYGATGPATDFLIAALLMVTASLLLSAIDFIATILNMRAPGMTLHKMPLLPWAVMVSSFLLLLTLPAATCADVMLLSDRHFGSTFFNPAGGGDPLLYLHLFWIFGHTTGLICILVAIGIAAHVVSAFSRRPVYGRVGMAYALVATALIGVLGWGTHMTSSGLPVEMRAFFLLVNLAVAVPLVVLICSLIATMRGGAITLRAPMLWAVGFIPLFALGALLGLVLGGGGANVVLRGTAYETAYMHLSNSVSTLFAFFAGWYFWFPKFSGYRYSDFLAKTQCALTFVGVLLIFVPMLFLGLAGMPRGVGDYPEAYAGWNYVSSLGVYVLVASVIVFFLTMALAFWRKRPAGDNPWGKSVSGLEWTLPSPPPYQTFNELPNIR